MKIYTRKGDDGTTGLYFGGRVAKNSERPVAYGDVDETQAALGMARSLSADDDLNGILIALQRDLWVVMADLATGENNRDKLQSGTTKVTQSMVDDVESTIDSVTARFEPPTEFVVPGGTPVGAALDVARTVARRAERSALTIGDADSLTGPYLNRLSDLLWTLARWAEGTSITVRSLSTVPSPSPTHEVPS